MAARANQAADPVSRSIGQWAEVAPTLDVSATDVFARVHRVHLTHQAQLSRVFTRHGINAASFSALSALFRAGRPYRLTVSALAEETLISSGGMTMRLDRLEEATLITRRRDVEDRRVVYAQLTRKGLSVVKATARDHFAEESQLLGSLGDNDRRQLARLLRRLDLSMEQSVNPPA